jgi:S1-C subfamily serine protease
LIVLGVQPDSPAAQAGVLQGDVLTAIEGQAIDDVTQLHAQLSVERIGKPVTLRLVRGGEPREVAVTVAAR